MKAILKENLCSEFMLDILLILLMIVSGFFFGIIAIMVGVGGGLLNVPFLIYVMEVDPLQATLIKLDRRVSGVIKSVFLSFPFDK